VKERDVLISFYLFEVWVHLAITDFSSEAQLAALRALYAGVNSLDAIDRYPPAQKQTG